MSNIHSLALLLCLWYIEQQETMHSQLSAQLQQARQERDMAMEQIMENRAGKDDYWFET